MSRSSDCLGVQKVRSRLKKLGLKADHSYRLEGDFGSDFLNEAKQLAGPSARTGPFDCVFIRLDSPQELPNLMDARSGLKQNGMIWAVWPKGREELREDDIRRFALEHGLVDVKVMSFSDRLSGLKLVIPVALRGMHQVEESTKAKS